ncbi:hypothetical protein SAMN05443144_12273 [Fodinibius roseus]|uniref:Uncharacterized protein n=1 Tax=Fodinibius roseus TaxID=1194090 RepID=A0A1M5I921_9BACT|nr:hypothetical protein [Fodinibius roseus]SHG24727.1 hypothetical protein SAMN05443144_12273 [Fodinibius roseus]
MSDKLIEDINKYTNSDSLLVHTQTKGLIRLYCPFTVKVIQSVDSYMVGEELEVVKVKVSPDLDLVYVIGNTGYYHYYFSIQI